LSIARSLLPVPCLLYIPAADRRRQLSRPFVLWLAAEASPWASTGGLGDVVGSLPAVLRRRGWDVRLCLPLYRQVMGVRELAPPLVERELPFAGRFPVAVREAIDPAGGVPTYFVDCPPLFDRPGIYSDNGGGYDDNPLRFAVFQLGARMLAETLRPAPVLLHCHDWHAALLPALLQLPGQRLAPLHDTRTVLTIHNLQYQGECDRDLLADVGLPRALWHPAWAEHFDRLNPLKAGILSADRITTVSPTYANEIRTPEHGLSLDGPLRERGGDLSAILNGIDESADPATDPTLPAHYGAGDLGGRALCKAALRAELGLPGVAGEPLIGYVGRMTTEKGVDLFAEALPELVALGAKVVAVGTGDRTVEAALAQREAELPGRFRAVLRFDAALARRVYAGVDVLVVPSRVEPCGLVQLYALRYGAVPVVHAVGGLRDTVRDGETGFLFHEPTAGALTAAVRRALELFRSRREWSRLREAGMTQDWSWTQSAAAYDALYKAVLAAPPLRRPPPPLTETREPPPDWGPELPAALGRSALRLMVQGPARLYAHWEQPGSGPLELLLEERPTGLCFLIGDGEALGTRWLAAAPEHAYRALLRRPGGPVVAVSNPVLTPRDRPVGPDEPTPAWLEAALRAGLFDDRKPTDRPADRWSDVFLDEARSVPGPERAVAGESGGAELWGQPGCGFLPFPGSLIG
jgi:starch synthase